MMIRLSILFNSVLVAAVSLLSTGAFAEARELYVSPDGDNTTGTSWENALHTPNDALDVIKNAPDDTFTVYISEGEYEVTANDTYPHVPSILIYERCEMVGGWSSFVSQTPTYDPSQYITKFIYDEIGKAYCRGSLKGIHWDGNGIEQSTFKNEETGQIDQCYFSDVVDIGNGNRITNSQFINQTSYSSFSNPGLLYNCVILQANKMNKSGGIYSEGEMIHCTVYRLCDEVLDYPAVTNYGHISNSIIWDSSSYDFANGHSGTIMYSCFRGTNEGIGNLSDPPTFLDVSSNNPSEWDVSLSDGSPCVDKASVDPQYAQDIFGASRPGGDGKACMGAIESPDRYEPGDFPLPGAPDVIYVSPDGNNDGGESWETAYTTLQAGVEASLEKNVYNIWVAEGTYTSDSDQVVTVPYSVNICGGFLGTETSIDERGGSIANTIIDGEQQRRCVHNIGRIDGFTIERGRAASGAGVLGKGLTSNCTIQENYSLGVGGGVYGLYYGQVINCVIKDNVAESDGGGVYEADVSDSLIEDNSGVNGGGVWDCQISGCIVKGNTASGDGGGCFIHRREMENVLIYGNEALNGGGVYINSIYVPGLITHVYFPNVNCTITKNVATDKGGGIYRDNSWLIYHYPFINCIIWDNNEVFSNTSDLELSYSCAPDGTSETNSISTDPLFVYAEGDDPEAWDFHLQNDSPCRMSGTAEGIVPELDLEGKLRQVRHGYAAMGAYTGEVTASLIWSD